MKELIEQIRQKNKLEGITINPSASEQEIANSELIFGFSIPNDFKSFYSICNGFECNDDIFNFLRISDITDNQSDYGPDWFYFSEYMIYSDMWGVRIINSESYEIFNGSYKHPILTTSLAEFLEHFAFGNVFETQGLYSWQEQLGIGETKSS